MSRLLLNACGEELQEEASEYAPLKQGQVAVTNAKNLKCKKIYHIFLPEYKKTNSERVSIYIPECFKLTGIRIYSPSFSIPFYAINCEPIRCCTYIGIRLASSLCYVQVFRDTLKQILRIAKSNSVSSIAIPSLGVANLGYPESVSASIIFQEIIAFHSHYPNSIQTFILVIYEKSVFQEFNKEFVQQMSGQASLPQVRRLYPCVLACIKFAIM